jgi:Protein of unknown function (DUF4239)
MLYWIYDIPTLAAVSLFDALFVGVCWLGIILFRPWIKRAVHRSPGLNEIAGDFLQYFGVIYGLLLGLLAVATYQNLSDVDKVVASEASSLAALYRDVSAYPEPTRGELQDLLRDYTRYVIDEAWPLQAKGIVPSGGVKRVAAFQERLSCSNPRLNRKRRCMIRPCGSSTRSSNIGGRDFTASIRVFPRCSGTRSGSGVPEYHPHLAVRPPPRRSPAPWRHPFVLPRHHDLSDRADGSPLPWRSQRVAPSLPIGLRSADAEIGGATTIGRVAVAQRQSSAAHFAMLSARSSPVG